jgi:DNA-binding protein
MVEIMQIPTPRTSAEFVVATIALIILGSWFIWVKFGGKNVTNTGSTVNRVQEQLAQDKIRIERLERDVQELWIACNEIRKSQSRAVIEIMGMIGEIKGLIKKG